MSKRRPRGRRAGTPKAARGPLSEFRWESWGPALMIALYVARLFVPEDPGGHVGYGAPFVVLWLILVVAWLLIGLRRKVLAVRWELPDWLMLALVSWHTLSAVVAAVGSAPRPAFNMLWDWIAIGSGYFLARQLLSTPRARHAVVVAMIGIAVGLSAASVYESAVQIPADQAAYLAQQEDTLAVYELTGQWMPVGSNIRAQFENRLFAGQPSATFALTNTFAGVLVPWLVVLWGWLAEVTWFDRRRAGVERPHLAGRLAGSGLLLLILLALASTHSRTAVLAAVVGTGLAVLLQIPRDAWQTWKLRAALLLGIGVSSVGIGVVAVTRDFSGAWRSLSFRLEYWQSTWAMILENPWWGCGPGQFQDFYTRHKMPAASEEVQDPHNWLFEIWATAGTPGMLLLVALLAVWAIRLARSLRGTQQPAPSAEESGLPSVGALAGSLGGVALGVAVAWLSNFAVSVPTLLCATVGIVAAWWTLEGWELRPATTCRLTLAANCALLINLLAAGSIGYPAVADSLWLLAALGWAAQPAAGLPRSVRLSAGKLVACACGALLAAAFATSYLPIINSRMQLGIADNALITGDAELRRAALIEATRADPWSIVAAQQLAAERFADYEQQPQASVLARFVAANDRVLELAPQRSGVWAQSAEYYRDIYHRTADEANLQRGIDDAGQAIALYPNRGSNHALLAQLQDAAGARASARESAVEALELDERMRSAGHADRLLDASMRAEMESLKSSN